MTDADTRTVVNLLSDPRNIVIIPHQNPDGDAIGSVLGLGHYLRMKGHRITIISPNDFPKFLKWMPGVSEILIYDRCREASQSLLREADLVFTLDFNDLERCGELKQELIPLDVPFIMIDHHQAPTDYAKVTYSDTGMSSTCEMVYTFIETLGDLDRIDEAISTCLYAGILTDTGSFKFSSTKSRTHRVVADLMDKGARNAEIHNKIFDTNTPDRLHLLGCALNNLVILPEYHTAYITLSQEELERYKYQKGDTEGFVNYGLTLEGICFAAIFIERKEEGLIKISLRSQGDFSVNEFARAHFNGGGHRNAAGGRSEGPLSETVSRFTRLLETYKDQLKG